ncbi:MAG: class I SAM-dependent methyltransferase [Candidatus Hodarchaeota archaeon]
MTTKDSTIIKKIVRMNFDRSADPYEEFERRFGLFHCLTKELAELCDVRKGMRVCDIGCGSGTSSFALQKIVGSEGIVYGVDFSEKMLEIAQAKLNKENANIKFMLIDADELEANVDFKFHAVLYNASIFLIPEPMKTLQSTYRILTEKGMVGMNFLIGLYGSNSELSKADRQRDDLFLLAKKAGKPFAPYGRKITDAGEIPKALRDIGFKNIEEGVLSKKMSLEEWKTFYSIPAQSAGLWPRNKYEERLRLLDSLVEYLQNLNISAYYQFWGWYIARK